MAKGKEQRKKVLDEDRIGEKIFGIGGINLSVKPEIDKIDPTEVDNCIKFVLEPEGGYANNPLDPGGETKYKGGISKRAYLDIMDIANLTV